MFNNKQQYDQYGQPVKKGKRRIVFIFLAVLAVGILVLLASARGNRAERENGYALVSRNLGAGASINLPESFVLDAPPRVLMRAAPPENQNSSEFITLEPYGVPAAGMSIEQLEQEATQSAEGPLADISSERITRKEQESGKGEQQMLRVTNAAGNQNNTTTNTYYYIYTDNVWKLSITHEKSSALDAVQKKIAESFIAGDL